MWKLVPWPGMEPRPPALGAQSLGHWATREVPLHCSLDYWETLFPLWPLICLPQLPGFLPNPFFILFLEGLLFKNEWIYFFTAEYSVQFSRLVMSDSLRPHEPQHTRPPCPSPTPGVHPNPCPSSQWCHPTISSSVIPFSSCPQSFPASGSFQMSQFFTSGSQSIGVSASTSVFRMNTQDWSPLGWTGWISLQSRDSQESCPTPQFKSIYSLALSFLYSPTLTPIHNYCQKHSLD